MRVIRSIGHVTGGALLIAGTTIGVGMLALPVVTGPAGFTPSALSYVFCWLFMMATGLLTVELSLWMPKDTSFISMAEKILGNWGKVLFWIMYLFLFFTVMIAHVAGGGDILKDLAGLEISNAASAIVYTAVFAPVVYMGTRFVDRLNMFLISGVAICYFAFIFVSISSVQPKLLSYTNWNKAWSSLPVLFTAFSYHVIIPTLVTYMERNVKKIRLAVMLGATIPFVVYLIWEFLILGIVPPHGEKGLIMAESLGQNAIGPLREYVKSPLIYQIGKFFAFFAMTTSFIPLALSFFDFMADGLKWKKKGTKRLLLCLIVFGLPLLVTLKYPKIFLVALGYAGGVSCSILFGLMPPLMVWVGRYKEKLPKSRHRLFGGKFMLGLLMLFAFGVFAMQLIQQI